VKKNPWKDQEMKNGQTTTKNLILCAAQCRYNVIKRVLKRVDYKFTEDVNVDWDIFWSDVPVQPECVSKL